MTHQLDIQDLHVSYGSIRALRGVTFHIDEGQTVSLIGANGAGKSTTLNAVSGLLKPVGGRIRFRGQDITGWRADRVSALGLVQVPEGRQIIATMTVHENLIIGAHLQRTANTETLLDQIYGRFPRLSERHNQRAGLLSGGEQQMLAVGRALMMQPDLLMLDEPSMGLSPMLVNEVFDLLRDIKGQGISILVVEQNARKALQIADYAYVLERGVIAREGSAAQLREDPHILAAYLG
ncbi:MAG: ABC transporter ATP-binding protein [Anaerolineae bacterium]|nr:ABC transporter ATP-binding protein [Anaerolineae bacterium]